LELFSVGELFMALKARLYDSNKNLVTVTLGTLGFMAAAMGPAIDKHSKVLLSIAVILFMDASWVHLLEGLIIYVAGFTVGMPF
jgi:hypothetical protein